MGRMKKIKLASIRSVRIHRIEMNGGPLDGLIHEVHPGFLPPNEIGLNCGDNDGVIHYYHRGKDGVYRFKRSI
jgi:hypothetical protein